MPDWIATAIDKWGINVVVIIGCLWFIKYMFDTFMKQADELRKENIEQLNKERDSHADEAVKMAEQLDAVKETLNNNTIVMQQILEVMRK